MKEPWKNCLLKENSQIQTAILQCPGLLDWQKCGQPGTALHCTVQYSKGQASIRHARPPRVQAIPAAH